MALKTITFTKNAVEFNGQIIELRGLSFSDIHTLLDKHHDALDTVITAFRKSKDNPDANMNDLVTSILATAPQLVNEAIAISADEPESVDIVSKLPLPTQLELVQALLDATFKDAGGFGNFIQMVAGMVKSATNQIQGASAIVQKTSH